MTEGEVVVWHCSLNEHEFEQMLAVKDRETWHAVVHMVAKSWTQIID